MRNRNAKFVSAVLASTLAGASVGALTHGAALAATDCLSGPKGASPAGSHWFYRVDRATKRHCWYLGGAGKLAQSAPPKSFHSPKAIAPVAKTSVQRPIADARAELPSQSILAGANRNEEIAMAGDPADSAADDARARPAQPSSVIATRWPEPTGVSPAVGSPLVMASNLATDVQPNLPAPPPPATAAPLAAAQPSQARSASIPMLLSVMTGALALAGITASIVLKLGGARNLARSRPSRDGLWRYADDDRMTLSPEPVVNIFARRGAFPRDLDEPAEPEDRVTEFYRKLSERSPSRAPS